MENKTIWDLVFESQTKWIFENMDKLKALKKGGLLRISGEGEPYLGDIALDRNLDYHIWNGEKYLKQ